MTKAKNIKLRQQCWENYLVKFSTQMLCKMVYHKHRCLVKRSNYIM